MVMIPKKLRPHRADISKAMRGASDSVGVSRTCFPKLDIKNMAKKDVMSPGRFVSLDILSPRTFCPTDIMSLDVLPPCAFCLLDVLSLRMFCNAGSYVPSDVLSPYVMSPDNLSGHRYAQSPEPNHSKAFSSQPRVLSSLVNVTGCVRYYISVCALWKSL
jgi:hypothetical protein